MDQNEVVKTLRSCLISCKGGIRLDNLRADYSMIAGEPLPFKKFGFSSIEAFIRSMSDFSLTNRNGELYVDAIPSKTTAHLTKLISRQKASRQKARRKSRTQARKCTRYTSRGYTPVSKNSGSQLVRSYYQDPPISFTKSTPGKSNLYTDFSRPIMPLMETIVQCPLLCNNNKPKFIPNTSTISPNKRLKDKITNPNIPNFNQSLNKSKHMEEIRNEVLNERAVPSVINTKPKTVELKSSKLCERLKITPDTQLLSNNDGHTCLSIISDTLQITSINNSDPRNKLEVRANSLELPPPVYKMYTQKAKDSSKITIYASVKIGAHTFHTFPDEAKSKEEAEKIAARLALMNLAKEPSSPEVTTVDVDLVKERILIIITRHQGGVFMHQLPVYYSEQYGEALPNNWQRIIEECPDINQERGVGDSTILCRSVPNTKHSEAHSSNRELYSEINYTSSEKIQLNPIGPIAPDKLKVPEATLWNVYTTCVISTVEIWVRLVDDDNNDKFINMMNEMTDHYKQIKEPTPAPTCIVGDFYAILEDNYWHRVQCVDFDSDIGTATVVFIDEGYEDQYKRDLLYPLEKKFCLVPAQAIRIVLQGLEDFRDYSQMFAEIENHLIDRVFCAKVHNIDTDDDGMSVITVTLYDTSREDDIDMNKVIFDKIIDNIVDTSKVHTGQLIELYVTHIDEHGKVYAQLNSFARTCLLSLLNNETMSQVAVNIMMSSLVKSIDFTKMYFVQLDSQWYRARVTDIRDNYEVTVFLVDFGRTVTALRGNLLHMDKISKTLQNILPQAMQMFLHNIDRHGEKLVKRFNELVSSTDLLLAKVVRVTVSGIPVVEIFKRIGPNNMLASINTSLIYDEELTRSSEDSNNNIKPKKRLERKNSRILESYGKLNPPAISDIGQYFDVHVTLAAHPGHFIVQPLNDKNNLKKMMLELQKCYNACDSPQLESIGEGKLYAAKFTDNYWYRVYVTNIISDDMVSVYLCDFGDVTIVSRSSLQPLKGEFLELPYQAVKAKLIGIQPMNTDWSVEDCLRFKDLVLHKNFVSIVVESMFDHFSPANSTVLGLRLIDVSTDKDIFIDELLVNEKRAKLIEGKSLSS